MKTIKKLKRKVFNKQTITWDDLKELNIAKEVSDTEPFKERWAVTHGFLPGVQILFGFLQPTKAEWKTPLAAFEYNYLRKSKSENYFYNNLTNIQQGILFLRGNHDKTSAIKILNGNGLQTIRIAHRYYSPPKTNEQIEALYDDGIMDNRSDVTYIYFNVC